nr:MAG TPA: NADH dehydrogenase transmembrane subunit [Caudoviricetes sp.]
MGRRHNIGIVKPPYKSFLSELFTHNKKLQFLSFPATSPQKCSGWVFLFFPGLVL